MTDENVNDDAQIENADNIKTKDEEIYNAALNDLLEYRKKFVEKYDMRCLVFSVLPENDQNPMVVFDGDILDYTALATTVARELRKRILDRIGG